METKSKSSTKNQKKNNIEKEVVELQKKLNISDNEYLTMEQIISLHNKQQSSIIRDFVTNNSINNRL